MLVCLGWFFYILGLGHFGPQRAVLVKYLPIVVAALVPAAVRAVPATALAKIIVWKKEGKSESKYANFRTSLQLLKVKNWISVT